MRRRSRLVTALYSSPESAKPVIQALRQRGFRRFAAFNGSLNGRAMTVWSGFARGRLALLGAVMGGGAGAVLAALRHWLASPVDLGQGFSLVIVLGGLGALSGFAFDWLATARIYAEILKLEGKWMLPEETVLMVECQMGEVNSAREALQSTTARPAIFLLHPRHDPGREETAAPPLEERLTGDRLREYARYLASAHGPCGRKVRSRRHLRQLDEKSRTLDQVRQHLTQSARIEQTLSPAAEWLLDNAYLVDGLIAEVRRNLPKRFYENLPVLERSGAARPRAQSLAVELIRHTEAQLTPEAIVDFLRGYQEAQPLTMGELWAFPLVLRIELIAKLADLAQSVSRRQRERERADFWAHYLLRAARLQPESLLFVLAALARDTPNPPPHFAVRLVTHLHDEVAASLPVRNWLERKLGASMDEAIQREKSRQAETQIAIARVITSMRSLSQLDWKDVFEVTCLVEELLNRDPAGVYGRMDFRTRDMYRHGVEAIALASRNSEQVVAQATIDMAAAENDVAAGGRRHVGKYLLGKGRRALEARLGARRSMRRACVDFLRSHPASTYCGGILVLTALLVLATIAAAARAATLSGVWIALLAAVAALPASQLAVEIMNMLLTRLLPALPLPRLDLSRGIPAELKTLVVVPVLLRDEAAIEAEVEKLEVRYLANPEPNLYFGLSSDFQDSPTPTQPNDEALLAKLISQVDRLNHKYPGDRYFLLHRERSWNEAERLWMGWERKRGKIEQLNRHLNDDPSTGPGPRLLAGSAGVLPGARYVIALDADTQLPPGSARRLLETISHPLNWPVLAADGTVPEGYTVIQPRVGTNLGSANATRFSRLFSDPSGTDPYMHMVSDVYQDLAGEGSFHGKGIYDARAFHTVLSGRFPENAILSHDLIEGAHARVAHASDIELMDTFPADYPSYVARQHRWIRGDWQILEWLFPRVPAPGGQRRRNRLSAFNRWKIFDNLRRSLLAPAMVLLVALSWACPPSIAWLVGLLVALTQFFPAIAVVIGWATNHPLRTEFPGRESLRQLLRQSFSLVLLPHQALVALDAIGRVLYRKYVSGRLLLEWQTAEAAHKGASALKRSVHRQLAGLCMLTAAAACAVLVLNPAVLAPAGPFLAAWLLSPLAGTVLGSHSRPGRAASLSRAEVLTLRSMARQTWRFFDDFVGPETGWLPPDNYQEALRIEVAERTSPTNIGLWLVSCLSARDLGYLDHDTLLERCRATLNSLEGLERHEGHLLNWYDTRTREPLRPRYVSTVDSGNLVASLWTLEQGVREVLSAPMLGPEVIAGLGDCLSLLLSSAELGSNPGRKATQRFDELAGLLDDLPVSPVDVISCIRRAAKLLGAVPATLDISWGDGEAAYWLKKLRLEVASWNTLVDRYLAWVEVLLSPPSSVSAAASAELGELQRASLRAVSLAELARDPPQALKFLVEPHPEGWSRTDEARGWLAELAALAEAARSNARRAVSLAGEVCEGASALSLGMNFLFLFDVERKLFFHGYNVTDRRMDPTHYDLLASEARLSSFVAIASGQVPIDHWWALGRLMGRVQGRPALLSWSGSMFEYLMPLLFQRTFDQSLLHEACRAAVEVQIDYARKRGIPWGISESAYSGIDLRRTYQYRAFGVPGLGFQRGLENDVVVAPYATMLALMVDPARSLSNLERLEEAGLRGRYGFYEAIDYNWERSMDGRRGVVVYAYLAHHQAMSLISLDNVLSGNAHRRRFHDDPRVRAIEPLVFERIPALPALLAPSTSDTPLYRLTSVTPAAATSRFWTPFSQVPRVQLLSNGSYTVMVTNAGGGYSRWKGLDLTRWRADTTRDCWGTFVYVKDVESGALWSAAYQPVRRLGRRYEANFLAEQAEFKRRDGEIETITEVTVDLEDDVEVRKITLRNHHRKLRLIELTSYCELVLAAHEAERAHPAFSGMFVETEYLPDSQFLLARRRRRKPADPQVWIACGMVHRLAVSAKLEFETDRAKFVGRGRTLDNPAAMTQRLSGSTGFVLDPIFSIRRRLFVEPGWHDQVLLVTVAAETRQKVLQLVEKYRTADACEGTFQRAWVHAQLELRYLGMDAADAHRFQELAGHLLYPNAALRPPSEVLRASRLSQHRLWAYGISGDLPIVCIAVADANDLEVVRELLLARRYWRQRGLRVDVVILDEESAGYEQPIKQQLGKLIAANLAGDAGQPPGGIFLLSANQMPREDITLIQCSAHVALVAARGPLAQQMSHLTKNIELPPAITIRKTALETPPPPMPELALFARGRLGGFTRGGREYVITLKPREPTPRPWCNLLSNPVFGCLVSESGAGFAWYGNSQSNRLLPWSNDPVQDPPAEALYLRDEDSGEYWTPTPLPVRDETTYRVRHGQGYTTFESMKHGIEHQLTVFVPNDGAGGLPVRVQRLRLRNYSPRRHRLTLTAYSELTCGSTREETQLYLFTNRDEEGGGALLARNSRHADYPDHVVFTALSPPATSFTTDRSEFLGLRGSLERPAALDRTQLAGRIEAGSDPCSALQTVIDLEPGERTSVVHLIGQAPDLQRAREIVARFRRPSVVEKTLEETVAWWDHLLGAIQVETPDESTNFLLNRWLLYQTLGCRIWSRAAFYQAGGAYGFRDQLQDVLALLHAAPDLAREHILRASACQFVEGDVLHWWHPSSRMGVRTRCADDLLWLVYATLEYIRVTGDLAILDQRTPLLNGRPLEANEQEALLFPTPSLEDASLLEHCRRALERGFRLGPHGLPCIGSGDWNDGLDRVGPGGKGESVWMAWFMVDILRRFADLCEIRGEVALCLRCRGQAEALVKAAEENAWDGEWYLRAFMDSGESLGSKQSPEMKIDSLPQSWAVISGAADGERAAAAMRSVENLLLKERDGLVLLFTPPFSGEGLDPGYIAGYPPGVRENGGQYTHAAIWVAMAFARMGDGARAVRILNLLDPIQKTRSPEALARYKVEPYAIAADVYSLPGRPGQGGWTWYTGSSGWLYRVWLEEVLGFRRQGSTLTMRPCIPPDWPGYSLTYRHGEASYTIIVENLGGAGPGAPRLEVDGIRLNGDSVELETRGDHTVRVRLERSSSQSRKVASPHGQTGGAA